MTASGLNGQQNLRQDAVMPMEVLSLYADPIWTALSGSVKAAAEGCRVFMHPTKFLGYNTHTQTWNTRNRQVANSERCLT